MIKLLRLLGVAFFGASGVVHAAEWSPSASLGLVHTDNITLSSTDPQAETAWELIPSIAVTQNSPRLTADAVYRMEAYRYQERDDSQVFNLFDGEARVAPVRDRFFVDLGGSRTEAIVNPEVAFPVNNLVISDNRADLQEYFAGPAFTIPFGGNTAFSGEGRRTWVRYDDPLSAGALDNYYYDTAHVALDNYHKGTGFSWAVRYDSHRAEYEDETFVFEHRMAATELGFWANSRVRVFAVFGKESAWDDPLDPSVSDPLWEVGFARNVGEGFSAELAAGHRTYGESRRGQLNYAFDAGSTSVSYTETPTTTSADKYQRSGLRDPGQPLDYLFRAGQIERYISKRFQWALSLTANRASFELTVFDEGREERTQLDGTPLPEEAQDGGWVSFTWRFGPRLDVRLYGSRANRDFGSGDRGELSIQSLTANYELGARTRLAFEYEQSQDQVESGTVDYRAKIISATVSRTFGRSATATGNTTGTKPGAAPATRPGIGSPATPGPTP